MTKKILTDLDATGRTITVATLTGTTGTTLAISQPSVSAATGNGITITGGSTTLASGSPIGGSVLITGGAQTNGTISSGTGGPVTITGGAGGANSTGGSISLIAGASAGGNGSINIGTSNTSSINIGLTSPATITNISGTLQLAGTGLTTTASKLNYLTSATGTTGTNTTNIVFSTSPIFATSVIGSASMDVFNTISTAINFGGATTGTSTSTGLVIGSTATGATSWTNIATAALTGAFTKNVNIGTGGTTGSTTTINIGSTVGSTTTINGTGTMTGALVLALGTNAPLIPLKFLTNTTTPTAVAGGMDYDGTVFYQTPNATSGRAVDVDAYYYANSASYTMDFSTDATAKSVLGSSTAGITVAAGTTYEYELYFTFRGSYGLTGAQTPTFGFTSTTVTLSPVVAYNHFIETGSNTTGYTTGTSLTATQTTTTRALTALTVGSVYYFIKSRGIIRVTGTGTVKIYPSISANAANADNTWTSPAGTIFKLTPIGNGTVTAVGIA